jgi:hypothetical protein
MSQVLSNIYFILFLVLFFEMGSLFVAQAGRVLVILLSQPPECWDYRYTLLSLASVTFIE